LAARAKREDPGVGALTFASFNLTVRVRTEDPALLDQLPNYLPHGWQPGVPSTHVDRDYAVSHECNGADGVVYAIRCGGEEVVFRGTLEAVLDALERDIRLYLVDHARGWLFVHAGVAGWRGRAIVVPAPSRAGKSTLTLELVRAGASYYSDEFAVLDESGLVHPFATPLQLRARPELPQQRRRPDEVGGQAGVEPIPVGLVAAVTYRPGSAERLEELTPGRTVLALLEHVPVGSRPEKTLKILEQTVSGARAIAGERGEAAAFARHLLDMIDMDIAFL
jgi:hypothetical protein